MQYVNHVRRELFCKKKHNLENLPPTEKMHFFCMLTGFYFRLVYGLQQLKKTLIRDVSAILLYVRLQKLGEFTLIVRKYWHSTFLISNYVRQNTKHQNSKISFYWPRKIIACMLPLMSDTDACPKVIIDKIKCGYKTGCTRKCSCRILGIECTLNCNNCIENCSNKTYNVEDVD